MSGQQTEGPKDSGVPMISKQVGIAGRLPRVARKNLWSYDDFVLFQCLTLRWIKMLGCSAIIFFGL